MSWSKSDITDNESYSIIAILSGHVCHVQAVEGGIHSSLLLITHFVNEVYTVKKALYFLLKIWHLLTYRPHTVLINIFTQPMCCRFICIIKHPMILNTSSKYMSDKKQMKEKNMAKMLLFARLHFSVYVLSCICIFLKVNLDYRPLCA